MQIIHSVVQAAGSLTQVTPTTTTDVKTVTPPSGARACLITVTTTDAWMSHNGVDPASTNRVIIHKDQQPYYVPFAVALKFVAASSANSVIDVAWLF